MMCVCSFFLHPLPDSDVAHARGWTQPHPGSHGHPGQKKETEGEERQSGSKSEVSRAADDDDSATYNESGREVFVCRGLVCWQRVLLRVAPALQPVRRRYSLWAHMAKGVCFHPTNALLCSVGSCRFRGLRSGRRAPHSGPYLTPWLLFSSTFAWRVAYSSSALHLILPLRGCSTDGLLIDFWTGRFDRCDSSFPWPFCTSDGFARRLAHLNISHMVFDYVTF